MPIPDFADEIVDALVAERSSVFVIAGLDPAIHAGLHYIKDHRVKPARW
jgi:hypothetical protein